MLYRYVIHALCAVLYCFNVASIIPPYEDLHTSDRWAEETLAQMSLQEKIGQLFMVATTSSFTQQEEALASSLVKCPYKMDHEYIRLLIQKYHIGGLIFLYKSTPQKQIACTNYFQELSKIPLLIGQDCEWGLSMRLYDTVKFPFNMALGAVQDTQLIYDMGCEIGRQCKAIGVHINFAPVVDVNNNKGNPVINYRSFGDDPEKVAEAGYLIMQGLQSQRILACAKHFPGHGDTTVDSHIDLPVIAHSRERLQSIELIPFKKLINEGVRAVMSAHLAVLALEPQQNYPATFSRFIMTDLLEKELGFIGLKITDGLGMEALTKYFVPGEIELNAFLAGNDILLCPLDVPSAFEKIECAIKSGLVTEEEVDRRVLKILKAKEWVGCCTWSSIDVEKAVNEFNSPHAHALKKQLYQQAITVVRSSGWDIKNCAVVQVGGEKKRVFIQELNVAHNFYISAQSIEQEMQQLYEKMASYSDIVISIFDMNKFVAKNFGVAPSILDFIAQLKKYKKNIITVVFGSPYSVPLFDATDTVIVGYEEDDEAQRAAACVLKGEYVATGKLPVKI